MSTANREMSLRHTFWGGLCSIDCTVYKDVWKRMCGALRYEVFVALWRLLAVGVLGLVSPPGAIAGGATDETSSTRADAYPEVMKGIELSFPRDHGAHPDFRTEWWYVTGWLNDTDGHERGFQVTFFRVRPRPENPGASRFAPGQLILAHAAIADPKYGRLLHAERSERLLPPLNDIGLDHTKIKLRDWTLAWTQVDGVTGGYRSQIDAGEFALDLSFIPQSQPVLNGAEGYSRKAPDPKLASYYYSRPQLLTHGSLRIGSREHVVRGLAWLDHEWSSEILPQNARGWDWIGINLHDGGGLMAFQMRGEEGKALWTAGTHAMATGQQQTFGPGEVRFEPLRYWQSPRTGARYVVEWRVLLPQRGGNLPGDLRVEPLMDDQELDSRRSTGAIYWEGAVRLKDGNTGTELGRGYLEMTGYSQRLEM